MRLGRHLRYQQISRENLATRHHHGHNTCPAIPLPSCIAWPPQQCLEPRPILIDLRAWRPQPGNLHNCLCPQPKPRVPRQSQQVYTVRQHVLPHLPRPKHKSRFRQFFQLLRRKQMHLAKIRLRRIASRLVEMLHRRSTMRVALHALAF